MPARRSATKTSGPTTEKTSKRSSKNSAGPAPELNALAVTFRTDTEGEPIKIQSDVRLQKAAMQWRSIVRNRRRWADEKKSRDEKDRMAYAQLLVLGLSKENLECIAAARIVEVGIPFEAETLGWEARVIPWEYLLSAASRKIRPTGRVTVIRHLQRQGRATEQRAPGSVLYVESAPGKLCNEYNFSSERKLVEHSLTSIKYQLSQNPTALGLREAVSAANPDIIHLAGFDSHQLESLIQQKSGEARDGYLMAGEKNDIEQIGAEQLAGLLNAGKPKPLFVGCNLYNSASRVCALTVAEGAGAAVGFQDEFDDSLAELFFSTFYQAWQHSGWKLLESFQAACQVLRDQQANLNGTGVVLWSDRSLLQEHAALARQRARRASPSSFSISAVAASSEETIKQLREENAQVLMPASRSRAAEILQVEAVPYPELNYSALHNNRPLFRSFKINKYKPGRAEQIRAEVTLYVGGQSASFSTTYDQKEWLLNLRDEIRVPLLHSAWSSLVEPVRTSLSVRVSWGDFEIYSRTFSVTLLPLDQWRDDDVDRIWLPSFVLPRDPTVRLIVDSAQRYLMALRDDSSAGFDGYQSFDETQVKQPEIGAEAVDDQVRALWATLVYDSNIAYINPPPTYSIASQRLRSPSEVVEGRRGTCIDTTLLLASCLEYIEIYPVIFLLNGHAFAGYWRHHKYQEEFKDAVEGIRGGDNSGDDPSLGISEESRNVPRYAWFFDKNLFALITQKVREQKLVPLESTWLTQRGPFWEAIDEGVKNLRYENDFHSMLDIYEARGKVTPIPMRGR